MSIARFVPDAPIVTAAARDMALCPSCVDPMTFPSSTVVAMDIPMSIVSRGHGARIVDGAAIDLGGGR
jgi:hypothetical protein